MQPSRCNFVIVPRPACRSTIVVSLAAPVVHAGNTASPIPLHPTPPYPPPPPASSLTTLGCSLAPCHPPTLLPALSRISCLLRPPPPATHPSSSLSIEGAPSMTQPHASLCSPCTRPLQRRVCSSHPRQRERRITAAATRSCCSGTCTTGTNFHYLIERSHAVPVQYERSHTAACVTTCRHTLLLRQPHVTLIMRSRALAFMLRYMGGKDMKCGRSLSAPLIRVPGCLPHESA
jgi:hypothetical protein